MIKNFMADKLIISFEEYTSTVEKLALQIYHNYSPSVLVGIMRGAAPIIDILSRIFKVPTAYVVIQSYSGETVEDQQGELIFARDMSAIAKNEDFKNILLVDDLSDTGLTLNKSIDWLKQYEPIKSHIKEIRTACLWKKKSSIFKPDYCPVLLDGDPWIVQPYEYYDEIDIDGLNKKHLK
jgi:hypoxanthine phosphoribosyltransferase